MRKRFQIRYFSQKQVRLLFVFALSLIILVTNIYPVLSLKSDLILDTDNSVESVYRKKFVFHTNNGSSETSHELYVSIPILLYNHFVSQKHNLFNISEYSNYITPNIFKSVAENIQKVTGTDSHKDEAFANAVLEIIQQIQYNSSNVKFPIETLIENSGDCDPLSILYASIMKAGGFDVVLFFYTTSPISHVNVGIHLTKDPIDHIGKNPFYYEHEGKKYFTVETVTDFWKVGDQPEGLRDIKPTVISLEDHQTISPLQISSNIDNPSIPTSISMNLISSHLGVEEEETYINVSGSISPNYPNQPVFLNIIHNSFLSFNTFKSVITDEVGNYSFIWNFNSSGTYSIQASWNGLQNYGCSASEKLTFYIGLAKELKDYEINNTVSIGPEIIRTTELNSSGNRIMEYQSSRKILDNNFIDTNVLLSAEFIILRNNESISSEQKLTIPSFEYTLINRRKNITRVFPERTVIIPNYKQKMNNHLEFKITQNEQDKYFSSVNILNDYDFSQIIKNPNSLFYENSQFSKENNWFKIVAEIIEDKIFLKFFDENITYFSETVSLDYNTQDNFRILLKYEPDSIIVIKDLQIESIDQPNSDEIEVNMFDFSKIFTKNNLTNQSIRTTIPEKEFTESISVDLPIIEIFVTIGLSIGFIVCFIFYRIRRK